MFFTRRPNLAQRCALFRCNPRAETVPGVLPVRHWWVVVGVVGATHASSLLSSSGISFRCSIRVILPLGCRYRSEQRRQPSPVPSRGLMALPTRHARIAAFGVRQPWSRSSACHTVAPAGYWDAGCARHVFTLCAGPVS